MSHKLMLVGYVTRADVSEAPKSHKKGPASSEPERDATDKNKNRTISGQPTLGEKGGGRFHTRTQKPRLP